MLKISSFLTWIALITGLFLIAASVNAQQMYKCKVNGTVTYQQDPCPVGQVRKPPTLQELNAGEKKRREAAAAVAVEKSAVTSAVTQEKTAADPKSPQNSQSSEKFTPTASTAPTASTSSSSFSCDGRKHCSQMKSCAEAHFFLANCPGVKMDGDKDGIPCEEQWCTR
jgi:thiol:disulfide interchange protein